MAELKDLSPYSLKAALLADRADNNDCFILDVGHDEQGNKVASLQHVSEKVDNYLLNVHDLTVPITKLYVIGDWHLTSTEKEPTESETGEQARSNEKSTLQEQEWHKAAENVANLVIQMPVLKELTWISELPFVACILEKLPTSLTKLVLDLGQPVRLHKDGDHFLESYISSNEMKSLQQQTGLKELRLFRMQDSFQSLVWETVYRNTSEGGMRVLDLQMAAAPLVVRSEHWRKALDVVGLTVPNEDSQEKEYKGIDSKGILHYRFGTGEYLDDSCMRKARIASGLDEAKPLPLWYLKLDGFVVDHLPFMDELSGIVLLTCGEDCVDAGLRAPATTRAVHNKWSKKVNNAVTHCMIQWPMWTGIFDDQGDQRDLRGNVVSQETGLSTPVVGELPSPGMRLTEESLHMKELNDTLDGIADESYFSTETALLSSSVAQTPLGAASNVSTRGSEVTTPTVASFTQGSQPVSATDGSIVSGSFSSADDSLVQVNSADSGTSTEGSFEQISAPAEEAENATPKTSTFKHKVRRSWDWLSGSS